MASSTFSPKSFKALMDLCCRGSHVRGEHRTARFQYTHTHHHIDRIHVYTPPNRPYTRILMIINAHRLVNIPLPLKAHISQHLHQLLRRFRSILTAIHRLRLLQREQYGPIHLLVFVLSPRIGGWGITNCSGSPSSAGASRSRSRLSGC
jgi:hypothetical protein